MTKITLASLAASTTQTGVVADTTMVSSIVNGLTYPWSMGDTDVLDVSGVRYVAGVYALIGFLAGGLVTRKRISANPDCAPWLGFVC
jgi:hypothetical protein